MKGSSAYLVALGLAVAACGADETSAPATEASSSPSAGPTAAPADPALASTDGAPAPIAADAAPLRTLELGDGLEVEILREGVQRTAEIGDTLLARYEARVKDAEQPFATTRGLHQPQKLVLDPRSPSRPIDGVLRALTGLAQGTRARIHVPPALAYGKDGLPSSSVPADASLVFDVEIVEVLP